MNKLKKEHKEKIKRKDIHCPMCGAGGKENFKIVEDKAKILSYISVVPIYAKKCICNRCGYEF